MTTLLIAMSFAGSLFGASVTTLHRTVDLLGGTPALKIYDIYLVKDAGGQRTGSVVVTYVDGARATGSVVQGEVLAGEKLFDRRDGHPIGAAIMSYHHDVDIDDPSGSLRVGQVYRLIDDTDAERGLVMVTASHDAVASANVLSGDPGPGHRVREAGGEATMLTAAGEDRRRSAKLLRRPARSDSDVKTYASRYRFALGFDVLIPQKQLYPSLPGLNAGVDGKPGISLGGFYEKRFRRRDFLYEVGALIYGLKFSTPITISAGGTTVTGNFDYEYFFLAVPLIFKWNTLPAAWNSELRLTAGLMYAHSLVAKVAGQFSTGTSLATSQTSAGNMIEVLGGLEYVYNTHGAYTYFANFDYEMQAGGLVLAGPRVMFGLGF